MRYLFLIVFTLGAHLMSAQSKGAEEIPVIDPSQVAAQVVQNFTRDNPGISATWRNDGDNYRANYLDPNTKLGRIIIYNKNGQVLRRENEVDQLKYPDPIKKYYDKNYPGEVYQVWDNEETPGSTTLYYTNRNTETIWFDKHGNLISGKQVKKMEKVK